MGSLKRIEEGTFPYGVETEAMSLSAKPLIKHAQKEQVYELSVNKKIEQPAVEEEKAPDSPEVTTLQKKHLKYDFDNEETREARQQRKRTQDILNADAASRAECERISQ